MGKIKGKNLILMIGLIFLISLIGVVSAHQPRLVFEGGSVQNPIIVESPEISKAYYGDLNGKPDYYLISSNENFTLYLSLLVPDLANSRNDFEVKIVKDYNLSKTLYKCEWEVFYEKFGGDYYRQGPELLEEVPAGEYIIIVYNQNNTGKYSLAIGNIESFSLKEIINTIIVMPKLKKQFFEKSPFTAYFNYMGLFLLIILTLIFVIILVIAILCDRRKKRVKKYRKKVKKKSVKKSSKKKK